MATITEDYVSFETAKLLKDKGFCGQYYMYYVEDGKYICSDLNDIKDYAKSIIQFDYLHRTKVPAPTLQMVMKWLREVHHLYIQVMLDSWALGGHMGYYVVIQNTTSDFEMMLQDALDDVFYNTYEEACEAAIKYCLENLI